MVPDLPDPTSLAWGTEFRSVPGGTTVTTPGSPAEEPYTTESGAASSTVPVRPASGDTSDGSRTPTGTAAVKRARKGRRKSAPEIGLELNSQSHASFKKEYHNKAERERTRKINNSIQEIRSLTGCGETDKVSILESAVLNIMTTNTRQRRLDETPAAISPLFDAMHIALAMVTLENRISGCNPSMAAVIGCSCEELVDSAFLECFHPHDAAQLTQSMRELLAAPISSSGLQTQLWRVLSLRVLRKVSGARKFAQASNVAIDLSFCAYDLSRILQ
jgi:PAS domain S-box-containing protein